MPNTRKNDHPFEGNEEDDTHFFDSPSGDLDRGTADSEPDEAVEGLFMPDWKRECAAHEVGHAIMILWIKPDVDLSLCDSIFIQSPKLRQHWFGGFTGSNKIELEFSKIQWAAVVLGGWHAQEKFGQNDPTKIKSKLESRRDSGSSTGDCTDDIEKVLNAAEDYEGGQENFWVDLVNILNSIPKNFTTIVEEMVDELLSKENDNGRYEMSIKDCQEFLKCRQQVILHNLSNEVEIETTP